MKKKLIAVLAVALIAALGCGVAFAATGDITVKDAKAYADAAMTQYVGTIPAGTSLMGTMLRCLSRLRQGVTNSSTM